MRLAVVSDAVHPWNTGGKEVRHHELLTRLAGRGHQIDVYTMHWWSHPSTTHRADGLTYHALCRRRPLYRGPRRSIGQAAVFAIATFRLVTCRFDVVEVDAIPFLPLFPMRLVTWVRRRPMVVTWYEYWGRDYWVSYLGRRGLLAALVERTAVSLPDRVIATSPSLSQRLQAERSKPREVAVVPPGVDPAQLSTVEPENDGAELVVVGRLLDHKKVDVALGATALLRSNGRAVRLHVIGDGPERDALAAEASRLGIEDAVSMDGFTPDRADVLSAIAGATALLFPSVREGFGMVALESLALGTPVVTSDHPDNFAQHLVSDGVTGVVCPPDATAVAAGVERVIAGGDTWRANARSSVVGHDWDTLAVQVERAYQR